MKYCHFKGDFNLISMSNNQSITDGSSTTFTPLVIPILVPNALLLLNFAALGMRYENPLCLISVMLL